MLESVRAMKPWSDISRTGSEAESRGSLPAIGGLGLTSDGIDQAQFQRLLPGIGSAIGDLPHLIRIHVTPGRNHGDELIVKVHHQVLEHLPAFGREGLSQARLVLERTGLDDLGADTDLAEQTGDVGGFRNTPIEPVSVLRGQRCERPVQRSCNRLTPQHYP